jgi:hypothetical protein
MKRRYQAESQKRNVQEKCAHFSLTRLRTPQIHSGQSAGLKPRLTIDGNSAVDGQCVGICTPENTTFRNRAANQHRDSTEAMHPLTDLCPSLANGQRSSALKVQQKTSGLN